MRISQEVSESEQAKKYPIRCAECGQKEVRPAVIRQKVQRNHDGRLYDLEIADLPVTRCDSCGEVYLTQDSDDRIVVALREQLGLLTPEQIRTNLAVLNLSQKEAASALGVAAETVSRWVTGGLIQSRAMDNLLRAFFASNEVRKGFTRVEKRGEFGARVVGQGL